MNLKELQTEVVRELVMRNNKYPEWIQSGFLKKEVAERQFDRMKVVSTILSVMTERELQAFLKRAEIDPKKKRTTQPIQRKRVRSAADKQRGLFWPMFVSFWIIVILVLFSSLK